MTSNQLKILAIITMTIDHTALVFVDDSTVLWQLMRLVGRLTAPIFCFLLAEGFHHTTDRRKYLRRVGIFAVISHAPFYLMVYGIPTNAVIFLLRQSVMFTLFVSLCMLFSFERGRSVWAKTLAITLCFLLSLFGDWAVLVPIFCLIFYKFRGNFARQSIAFSVISVSLISVDFFTDGVTLADFAFQYGVLLSLIPLCFYNGKRGKKLPTRLSKAEEERRCRWLCCRAVRLTEKWGAYIYYPLHMTLLVIISFFVN